MANQQNLNRQISAFYDDYHRNRNRTADVWMRTHYWPAFVGNTLEVGGGTLHPPKKEYALVDLSTEAVRVALSQSIPAAVANGSQLPFATASFDTVACYDVLEHVTEPETFLVELCRVAKRRVVVAGPNYIAGQPGHLDRRLITGLASLLTDSSSLLSQLENPHLSFDDQWSPDRDAVTAANGLWVARQMQKNGYRIQELRSWEVNNHWLNSIPAIRCLGPFMFVVSDRI